MLRWNEFRGRISVPMNDEMWSTLLQFHREIVMPDIGRSVTAGIEPVRDEVASYKRETHANFDTLWSRFDRLESEYHALSAAVKRIEEKQ
jgi:hypothetical protein